MIKIVFGLGFGALILMIGTWALWASGKVLLPEMGLTNPAWEKWLVVMAISMWAHFLITWLAEVAKSIMKS